MVKILILADDFTGAMDTGIQFADRGIRTQVVIAQEVDYDKLPESVEVLVMDIESRALAPSLAGAMVRRLTAQAQSLGVDYIIKKTDSALRGNIGSELAGMAQALDRPLYFIPAYPALERITRDGYHYIGTTPISETAFGQDPYEPVTESCIPELIARQTDVTVHLGQPRRIPRVLQEEAAIIVVDAQTDDHIRDILTELEDGPRPLLLAGCAALAAQIMEEGNLGEREKLSFHFNDRLVVVVGSVHPITQNQVDYAVEHGFIHFRLTPEQKLDDAFAGSSDGAALCEAIITALDQGAALIIDSNDEVSEATRSYARSRGISPDKIRGLIAHNMGNLVSQLVERGAEATYLLTGGDTAMGFMDRIQVKELTPLCEIDQGSVLSEIRYGNRNVPIITKSGGFGSPAALVAIREKLKGRE